MKIEEARKYHKIDAVIVGAGLAGLRAALEVAKSGLSGRRDQQGLPDPLPLGRGPGRHRRGPGQRRRRTRWKCTCSTPSRAATTWPTRISSSGSSMRPLKTVYEFEHMGVPFSRTEDGRINQRPFGGHSAPRACFAQDITGHVLLHTLYEQCLQHNVLFFNEFQVLSLLLEDDVCARPRRLGHPRRAACTSSTPGGAAGHRRLRPRLEDHLQRPRQHRRRRGPGAGGRPAARGHGVRPVPPDRPLQARHPPLRGGPRRGRLHRQRQGRALHEDATPRPRWSWRRATSSPAPSRPRSTRAAASAARITSISICAIWARKRSWSACRRSTTWP